MSVGTTNGMEKINSKHPIIGGRSLLIRCNHADGLAQLSKVSLKKKIIGALINTVNATGSGYFNVNCVCVGQEHRVTVLKIFKHSFTNPSFPFSCFATHGISLMIYVLYYVYRQTNVLCYSLNVVVSCLPLDHKSSG